MVTEYGMSDLGPIQFEHQESSVFLGRDYNKSRNFSSQVAYQIDEEIRKDTEEAIDEIIKYDFLGIYRKVVRESK